MMFALILLFQSAVVISELSSISIQKQESNATSQTAQKVWSKSESSNLIWSKTWGDEFVHEYAIGVVENQDGGFVVVCGESTGLMRLVCADSYGEIQWNKSYVGNPRGLTLCSDGGFLIYGSKPNGMEDAYLIKLNSTGDPEWNRTLGESGGFINDAVVCESGGYALVGYGSNEEHEHSLWLIRINSDGSQVWNRTYAENSIGKAIATANEGFVLLGDIFADETNRNDVWVLSVDSTGDELWNKTYRGLNDDDSIDLARTTGGNLVVIAYAYFEATGSVTWLLRLNSVGELVGEQKFSYVHGYSLTITEAEEFAIVGDTMGVASDRRVVLERLDGVCNHLWYGVYGNGTETRPDEGYTVIECSTGGFVIAGYRTQYGEAMVSSQNAWLFKVADTDCEAPIWLQEPTDQTRANGSNFTYDLNATDPSGLDMWLLNDSRFTIDNDGVASNVVALGAGAEFTIAVSVNDTCGNTLSGQFLLTIDEEAPDFPNLAIVGIVAGIVGVAIAVAVIFLKRR